MLPFKFCYLRGFRCWLHWGLIFLKQNVTAGGINLYLNQPVSSPKSADDVKSDRDSQQMVSHLRKNLPFGLQTVLLLLTNQVLQVPVGCARPPPDRASGPALEIMTVIVMSSSLLPPGRREVKLPMESSHPTHSTSSSDLSSATLSTLLYS